MTQHVGHHPGRILILMPSWLGDAVMATPTLRAIRDALPEAHITGLMRPGIDEVLAGSRFFDDVLTAHIKGMRASFRVAHRLRRARCDAALILPNSFATALTVRLSRIPTRIGYARDGRSFLLTHRLHAPRRANRTWAPIPAVTYYWCAGRVLLSQAGIPIERSTPKPGSDEAAEAPAPHPVRPPLPECPPMELATTAEEERAADQILHAAGLKSGARYAVLNPGGNDRAKRWPEDRYAALAEHLADAHGLAVLINGSAGEAELAGRIAAQTRAGAVGLPVLGVTIGSLKAIVRRAAIMVTNDTGPRHFAAAFGVPLVSLFGPTDYRWTRIPARETVITADPTLPDSELANDHPDRCRIDRIELRAVTEATDALLGQEPQSA